MVMRSARLCGSADTIHMPEEALFPIQFNLVQDSMQVSAGYFLLGKGKEQRLTPCGIVMNLLGRHDGGFEGIAMGTGKTFPIGIDGQAKAGFVSSTPYFSAHCSD